MKKFCGNCGAESIGRGKSCGQCGEKLPRSKTALLSVIAIMVVSCALGGGYYYYQEVYLPEVAAQEAARIASERQREQQRVFTSRIGNTFKYKYTSESYYKGYILGTSGSLYRVKVLEIECNDSVNVWQMLSGGCTILEATTCSGNEMLDEYSDEGKIIYVPEYCVK